MRFSFQSLLGLGSAKKLVIRILFVLLLVSSLWQVLFAQSVGKGALYDTIQARENFRLGVNAFNYGYYNQAIVALEQSLALRPDNPDAAFWLGRSYYSSGYLRLGLEQWKNLIDQNQATISLKSFYNTLDYRYRQIEKLSTPDKYSLFMKLESNKDKLQRSVYFVGPTAVRSAQGRDEIYVVDYSDNKVVALDANGSVKRLFRGSLTRVYDRPFDILLRPKGKGFILSQESTNSLLFCDENGFPYKEVGSKGNGDNHFLGPQHLADSGDGYFYVADWGNRRIVKLDYEGRFVFSFGGSLGGSQGNFSGLQGPTGLVVRDNKLYVADVLQQKIFTFNQEGRFLETFIDSGLTSPESLLVDLDGNLLIADGNQIKLFDFEQSKLQSIYTAERDQKYINLNYDHNRNLMAVDFKNEQIDFITPSNKLYTDLFVAVKRVVAADYPMVDVDFLVQDRSAQPIVGLRSKNFQIIESDRMLGSELTYTSTEDGSVAMGVILGSGIKPHQKAVMQMVQTMEGKDTFTLIRGGKNPSVLSDSAGDLLDQLSNYQAATGSEAAEENLDISLRFALDSLVHLRKKKVVVFVSGRPEQIAINTYNIADLKNYLELQNAYMYGVLPDEHQVLSYLVENSSGKLYLDSNVRSFADDVQLNRNELTGYYTLRYRSKAYTDLARRYIPVEVGVRYVRRSGRDGLGFFAPLSSVNGSR